MKRNTGKKLRRLLSVVLAAVMLMCSAVAGGNAALAADSKGGYNVGDIIEFGSYPQSEVKDSATLSELNSLTLDWQSYGYYSGDGEGWRDDGTYDAGYGTMKPGDWMKYADVTYSGSEYRAVRFSQYRPTYTTLIANAGEQVDNGYYINTTYWFKFEPLKWRVLDPATGLVMCESIIDSQPYSNTIYYSESGNAYYNDPEKTVYANDYVTSSIRKWLNEDFYNTAFTSSEKSKIKARVLDNSARWEAKYDSEPTTDKICMLSLGEAIKEEYGFNTITFYSDIDREAQGTDYAKSQGLWVNKSSSFSYNGNSLWWLRSPSFDSNYACRVDDDGNASNSDGVGCVSNGIRPALNLKSDMVRAKTIIERLKDFFQRIIDWFRSLFNR